MTYYKTDYISPFGKMILVSKDGNLAASWFEGHYYCETTILKQALLKRKSEIFDQTIDWFDRYFDFQHPDPAELPLAPEGSSFQKDVWEFVSKIPYGRISTYSTITKKVAEKQGVEKMSAQAVGTAIGRNPLMIIIPCHRVIAKDGSLSGYSAGLDIKARLLAHEQFG